MNNTTTIRKPCKHCPFRIGSILGYTAEGFKALDDGKQAACHKKVGGSMQFNDPLPSGAIKCVGQQYFDNEVTGFARPQIALEAR